MLSPVGVCRGGPRHPCPGFVVLIEDRAYSVPVSPDHQHANGEIDIASLHAQDSTGLLDRIDRAVVWDIPLTTSFRGITRRDGVLLHGPGGWGEVAPFWDYGLEASAPWLASGLCQALGNSLLPRYRETISVNVTVPEISAQDASDLVRASGARTAKVKVSGSSDKRSADLERLEAVRSALGRSGKVRIDVNGAWDLDTARENLPLMDRAAGGLEYAEQPCATVYDLADLRRAVDVPIAADESIRLSANPLEIVHRRAADVAILKVAPLGGVHRALDMAERLGLPAVVSSALDTSVGIMAGATLAFSLPSLSHACGLGTTRLLTQDVAEPSVRPSNGTLRLDAAAPVSERLLNEVKAGPYLTKHWQTRLLHLAGALHARRQREARDPSRAVAGLPL